MEQPTENGKLLEQQEFVAFDTETTGLNAAFHRIVEIGAVKFRIGSSEQLRYATLVNPGRPMPPEVIPIHGITDEMVANAPVADLVLREFAEFCGPDIVLLAHNAPFDLSFLGCESDRIGFSLPDLPVLDTVTIARVCFPGLPFYSLESLTRSLNLAPSQDHRALADALLVKSLFEQAIAVAEVTTLAHLLERFPMDSVGRYKPAPTELPDDLADFRTAIEQKRRIEIEYRSLGGPAETRIIQPYLVQSRQSVIYITAFCEKARAERTFRVDRILRFRLVGAED
jgi:DNA polymerase III epsilon subunit family exonuclease